MKTQRKKRMSTDVHAGRKNPAKAVLFLLLVTAFCLHAAPAGITACAAVRLAAPEPVREDAYGVTWARVTHAATYEVRLTLFNEEDNKTVTRSYTTTDNHLDLIFYAAGCSVSVQVRAVPSAGTRSRYSTSAWGTCEDPVLPADSNGVSGYADASGGKFTLSDENGAKYSGWKKINNAWFYLDPADGCRTSVGWASINGATYYFEESGRMYTGWLAWEKNWYYLNPSDSAAGKMVTGWTEVSPGRLYYFTENASADHPAGSLNEEITNASYPDSRPPYVISGITGTSGGSTPQTQTVQVTQKSTGWVENPNGTWSYYNNGTMVKSAWKNVDGFWYYFDGSGIMQKGWQRIGGAWYYLEPNKNGSNGYKYGAAWMNTTTPDGCQLNASGQWVQNGQVMTADGSTGQGSSTAGTGTGLKQISSVYISLNVTDAKGGRCRYAEISGASDCTVKSQSCSTAYKDWTPGSTVIFTVELEPGSGRTFTSGTSFRCSGATVTGQSGDSLHRTVKLTYTVTSKLGKPEMFYVTDSNELKWMPVPYAKRYRVTVTGGDSEKISEIVTEPRAELWNYGDMDGTVMSVTVSALGAEGNKSVLESDKAAVNDVGVYKQSHNLNGTFEYKEGILRFRDDSGMALTGWQELCGSWFYFKKGGAAAGPGWFQDETGTWYYADSHYRMVTGNITDGGKTYFLNDGSRGDLPLGAWVQ